MWPIAEVKETNIVNKFDKEICQDQLGFDSLEDKIIPFCQPKVSFRGLQSLKASDAPQLAEIDEIKVKRRILDEDTELLNPSVPTSIPVVQGSNAPIHTIPTTGVTAIETSTNVSSYDNSRYLSFSQQFEEKFKQYAKFYSKEEEAVAKKFVQMMEGVCNAEMKKFDANTVVMQPMERQLLFQKV
ncbi:MAG: hypothetical protein EZS28_034727 [Streblomastix strix]|uniref:Uncharacterized protein n=1 Tax=Streblomastix strix TaxID=222440 RepID=A0A5J4UG53_9EUKA|nr:MAG: hypothetical protein EZS28_034727 [Streblomastix strix]